jgi:hypothetical protein
MAQENLDPHAEGYVFSPVNSVTGFFDSHDQLDPALQSLREAGFGDQDVGVFVGEEGAQTLDLSGQRHGFAVQLWRQVEAIFFGSNGVAPACRPDPQSRRHRHRGAYRW